MKKQYLIVKNRRILTKVMPDEIIYVLRDGRRLIVATCEREYVYYDKMKSVEDVATRDFFRPLDRCIVNMNYMKTVDVRRRRLIFINGDELFMGRDACFRTKAAFKRYLLEENIDPESYKVAEKEAAYVKKRWDKKQQ